MIEHVAEPTDDGMVVIRLSSGRSLAIDCTMEQYVDGMSFYKKGELIQNAFHFLSSSEREFLLTGLTDEEFDAVTLGDYDE